MRIGLSTYSLFKALEAGEIDLLGVIAWIAEHKGQHVEIVPLGFSLLDNPDLVDAVVARTREVGIAISSYTVEANLIQETEEGFQKEIENLKKQVDIGAKLGVKLMRHDAGWRDPKEATLENFQKDLPKLAEGCRAVADYAKQFGITSSVENHGYHVQHSDRVLRLVQAVGRSNYKTTLDVGNFLCVDEDPVDAVRKNIPFASMVHLKDFYYRPADRDPGEGWFPTASGAHLRGAIVGQGDIDMWKVIEIVKKSGYDGYISIEFEGMEDCRLGSKIGMENARRIWDSV